MNWKKKKGKNFGYKNTERNTQIYQMIALPYTTLGMQECGIIKRQIDKIMHIKILFENPEVAKNLSSVLKSDLFEISNATRSFPDGKLIGLSYYIRDANELNRLMSKIFSIVSFNNKEEEQEIKKYFCDYFKQQEADKQESDLAQLSNTEKKSVISSRFLN